MGFTYHDLQEQCLDKLVRIKATPELTLTCNSLIAHIRTAATPGALAPVYRPAQTAAVNLARNAYRSAIAIVCRADFRKAVEQSAKRPLPKQDWKPTTILGRTYTGD